MAQSNVYTINTILKKDDGTLINWYNLDSGDGTALNEIWSLTDPHQLHPDWTENIWQAIRSRKLIIGMTPEMCEMSWGSPRHTRTTTTASGEQVQWVYNDFVTKYLYFDNGILVSIQN